jgi:hypothetical protein
MIRNRNELIRALEDMLHNDPRTSRNTLNIEKIEKVLASSVYAKYLNKVTEGSLVEVSGGLKIETPSPIRRGVATVVSLIYEPTSNKKKYKFIRVSRRTFILDDISMPDLLRKTPILLRVQLYQNPLVNFSV